eukprot:CAMPEP_0180135900 /NCGR_PEP_ID=MMETSP0986-20121125/11135_1 /TAXON_ID=697907 /ORGANISM="non described non described, Strain CCMP2293" /LENGTH=521 /DNA_ID=CAMNT_0022076745 /DNA_START=45 /DNA_END=1610 /DNA_ORIENTATION=-
MKIPNGVVATIMLMGAAFAAYSVSMSYMESPSSLKAVNMTHYEEMRIENEALHEGMEHMTKKVADMRATLKSKCGVAGVTAFETGGLLQTQLEVCNTDLTRVKAERRRCVSEADRVDNKNIRLKGNLTKAKKDKEKFFQKADYLVSRLEQRTRSTVDRNRALRETLNHTLREEQRILSGMLKSNGVDLSRRKVDVLTSIDDDDDEENDDDTKSEFHRLRKSSDQKHDMKGGRPAKKRELQVDVMGQKINASQVLPSVINTLPAHLKPFASSLAKNIRQSHNQLTAMEKKRRADKKRALGMFPAQPPKSSSSSSSSSFSSQQLLGSFNESAKGISGKTTAGARGGRMPKVDRRKDIATIVKDLINIPSLAGMFGGGKPASGSEAGASSIISKIFPSFGDKSPAGGATNRPASGPNGPASGQPLDRPASGQAGDRPASGPNGPASGNSGDRPASGQRERARNVRPGGAGGEVEPRGSSRVGSRSAGSFSPYGRDRERRTRSQRPEGSTQAEPARAGLGEGGKP